MPAATYRPPPRPLPAQTLSDHIVRTVILAVPVMFQRAGLVLMIAVGLIMTGHAGENEQAYYSAAFPVHMSILVTGIGLLLSVTVLSAQAHGAARPLDCGRIWRLGLIGAAVLGAVCTVIMLHGQFLLRSFGLDEDLAMHGGRVLWAYAFGVPAMLMYVATTSFLESIGRTLPGFGISLGANVVNAVLCWMFVFGEFGFAPMGAEGAAMALTMTRGVMLLAIVFYAMRMADHGYFGVNAALTGFFHNIRKMLRIGSPLALANGLESVAFALVTLFAGWLGAKELATFQDALNLNAMIFMLAIGVATATSVRVANAVGRGDQTGLRRAGWVGAGIEVVFTGVLALLIVAGSDVIAGIYTSEAEVQLILVGVLPLVAWVSVADGLQTVILAATRGVADTVVPTVLQGISFWVVMVPLCYYLSHIARLGVRGLFIGIGVAVFIASAMLAVRFFLHTRRVILPI
jgi:multidrug resistance protein, MATE family